MRSYKDLTNTYKGGNLFISRKSLTSLLGCPEHLTGNFICSDNKLKTLNHGPEKVDGAYACHYNQLTDLVGCASYIGGDFKCHNNKLKSLVGGPQTVTGEYTCGWNKLSDLVGCASHISEKLNFWGNEGLTSLIGIHKIIKSCPNLEFDCYNITQGGIGLLLIANLVNMSNSTTPFAIINSYLSKGTKGMMECSKELISKGYKQYAKL